MGKPGASFDVPLPAITRDTPNSPAVNGDNMRETLSTTGASEPRIFWGGRSPGPPLLSTYQNSRVPGGKQAHSLNRGVGINSSGRESLSSLREWREPSPNLGSQMPASGQSGQQALLRTGSGACSVNPFLPRPPQPFFTFYLWQHVAIARCQVRFVLSRCN